MFFFVYLLPNLVNKQVTYDFIVAEGKCNYKKFNTCNEFVMIFLALTLVFRKNELISHFDLYFTLFFVDLRHTVNKKSSQAFSFTNFNELK